jgi:hypothetical protein
VFFRGDTSAAGARLIKNSSEARVPLADLCILRGGEGGGVPTVLNTREEGLCFKRRVHGCYIMGNEQE